jgi:predicted amidophosphoribosyltransferase
MLRDLLNFFVTSNCQLCQKIATRDICQECVIKSVQPVSNRQLVCIFGHSPVLISQIIRWKDFGVRSATSDFAMAFELGLRKSRRDIDVLTVIPTRVESFKKRGWDPLAELGLLVAKNLGVPFDSDLLVINRATREQRGLNDLQRKENIAGAFSSPETSCRVLVLDDVVTSGSTLKAAKVSLEKSGAAVSLGCLAYSRPAGPMGLST